MSLGMVSPLIKTAGEKSLNAMNLGRHVPYRQSGQFANGGGIQPFQISQNELPVSRLKLLDKMSEVAERELAAGIGRDRCGIDFFQTDQHIGTCPFLPGDPRNGCVMSHPIQPGTQGTTRIETFKTAPEGKMDFLGKVTAFFGIGFIGAREAGKSRPIFFGGACVKTVCELK